MYSEAGLPTFQITFHYLNGQSEAFTVTLESDSTTVQDLRQDIKRFLAQDWWTLKTLDDTVIIKASNVLKIEIKPPIETLHGDGVFHNAERVTALTRSR
ncbi:hypothetical protein BST81_15000 [Leptolyngbya sp. 'hensonii']|nr:hypothetical protein BST81_15000 [Leptolyngbya sp. 'hensonii']